MMVRVTVGAHIADILGRAVSVRGSSVDIFRRIEDSSVLSPLACNSWLNGYAALGMPPYVG
jgi:hypothetical protein